MDGQLSSMLSNCSVKKMYGWGIANMLTFAFMHHPYLGWNVQSLPTFVRKGLANCSAVLNMLHKPQSFLP